MWSDSDIYLGLVTLLSMTLTCFLLPVPSYISFGFARIYTACLLTVLPTYPTRCRYYQEFHGFIVYQLYCLNEN